MKLSSFEIDLGKRLSMRVVGAAFFASVFCAGSVVTAAETVDVEAMRETADARLQVTEFSLRLAADRLAASTGRGDCHSLTGEIAQSQDVFRSILVLDSDGVLTCDSVNRIMLLPPDLSQRQYFLDGVRGPAGAASIHQPVMGKNSGLPFIPVTVPGLNGGVVAATVDPNALIPVRAYCPTCGAIVVLDGAVVASSAQLSSANQDIVARLEFDGLYGQKTIEVRGMDISIEWQRSRLFDGLVFATYEALGGMGYE